MIDLLALMTRQPRYNFCFEDIYVTDDDEGTRRSHASGKCHKSLFASATQNIVTFMANFSII